MTAYARRLLIAVDLARTNDAFLATVADLIRNLPAEATLLHVCNIAEYVGVQGETGMAFDQYLDGIRARLQTVVARLLPEGMPVRVEVLPGDAIADTILQAAQEWNVDMIVVGTHGRRGLSRLVLGSVAEAVLRRSTVPVVVVPTAALEPQVPRVAVAAHAR